MKRITALLICLSATLFVFAQNYIKPTVENFARIIQMDNPTLAQFDTIWDVTTAYCGSSKDTCLLLVEHAVKICENLEDKVIYAQALDLKARAYLELGRAEEGLDLKKKIRAIMKEEEDMREVARMDVEIGNYYMNAGELKTAIDYLVSGMEILESEKDSVLIVHPILAIAGVYFYMGDVERSQSYINKAIALVETNNDMETLANILANQGVIYTDLGNTYQQKADTSLLNSDLYRDSAIVMYQEGLKEAERAYDIRKELGLDVMVPTTLLGTLNHKLGNYKEALALARNGLDQSKKAGALMLIMRNQESIAISELNLGNYNSALTQAQASHDLAVQQNMQQDINSVNEVLYKIYKKMGRNREAIEKLEEVHKQQKTENRLNAKKAIVDVETKYKTAEKEKQILQ
ncbi:MAG: tetratricopeptide repeat protein, partial [Saprospiraceae bacterium]